MTTAYPSVYCSLPYAHHTYRYGEPRAGDWGVDLPVPQSGTKVKVFAAPQSTAHRITAKIIRRTFACGPASTDKTSADRLARGGHAVVVGFYSGSTKIGTVRYLHIDAAKGIVDGASISRWGTVVGTVGTYKSNGCWMGRHLHLELASEHGYACFNGGFKPNRTNLGARQTSIKESNFIGFVGGNYVKGPRQACPTVKPTQPAPQPPAPQPPAPEPPPPAPQPPPTITLTVYNKVTNGATQMREDPLAAYLSSRPENRCRANGCMVAGTDRRTGGTYSPAVCQKKGARTTNGDDTSSIDDKNPGLFTSTRWYGIRLANQSIGYISEVWIQPSQRGGLGLPTC